MEYNAGDKCDRLALTVASAYPICRALIQWDVGQCGNLALSVAAQLSSVLRRLECVQWDFVGKLMEKDDPTLAAENAKAEREREAT